MKKKILIIFILIVCGGLLFILGYQSATYKGNNAQFYANKLDGITTNLQSAYKTNTSLKDKNASLEAQLTKPTPTPQIIYKTNTVTQYVQSSNNTQSQLDAIQRNQQEEVMREQDSCLASGGLYSTVSGCNH